MRSHGRNPRPGEPRIINSSSAAAMSASSRTLIRPSTPADLPAIVEIYRWNVLNGTGTFELEAPGLAEMTRRRDDVVGKSLPWLVAEREGSVLGYAYANQFRPRPAYRFCLE